MNELNSIVRLKSHANRTPTGRTSATATRKLVNYLAYGRGRPSHQAQREQRGVWLNQTNQQVSHEAVLAWVNAEGKQHHYTHQLILSVNEVQLTPQEYNDALLSGSDFLDQWRLIVHSDTAYSHAHVVAFGSEEILIKSQRFREWWLAVRQSLDLQQQHHLARREAGHEIKLMPEQNLLNVPEQELQTELQAELDWEVGL